MGDYETNRVFVENLRKYMERNGETQADISRTKFPVMSKKQVKSTLCEVLK